ncbi:pyruvate dehydrogenase (acetyl-transferring) E1 component subunit alpha, partial [Saccharothrix sp. MB29]|nr:pyruvate dehydrogenase (acetyl-transferring) E1 component subunit alpha [Saccharothrix sp. MB29]
KQQWADQAFFESIEAEAEQIAVELRDYCVNLPDPPAERIFSEVYAEGNPVLEAQRDEFLAYHAGFAGGEH